MLQVHSRRQNLSEMTDVIQIKDLKFGQDLFRNFSSGTVLDELLSSGGGLPKGVNYMVIGDPGVGKTTIVLDLLADIKFNQPEAKVLFISAEMNEVDLAVYVRRFPKFLNLSVLFTEAGLDDKSPLHNIETVERVLKQGWDVVAIDSFYELQSLVKDEEGITMKRAENMLLNLIKSQNMAENDAQVNTTFLSVQQVTKKGGFVGSNRLKHSITAMLELRLENPDNIYSDHYAVFTKHRRGDVGVRLYYDLSGGGEVYYDEGRFRQDQELRRMQSSAAGSIREFAGRFDNIFKDIKEVK